MKLGDIPKKQVFDVPNSYFEELPQKIQKRIATGNVVPSQSFVFRYKLQYLIPVIAFVVIGMFWFSNSRSHSSAESILATVETTDLISYLNDSEISTDDLIENGYFTADDADDIETEVYDLPIEDHELDNTIEQLEADSI